MCRFKIINDNVLEELKCMVTRISLGQSFAEIIGGSRAIQFFESIIDNIWICNAVINNIF